MSQELPKNYDPSHVERAIYDEWLRGGAFHATPDQRQERYVIMMPLPNVTGALHMGHAMDNVMQDLLIRWHRMQGDNTLWMPGTDHAGIATQAVVEKRLKELEGKTRHDIGREGLIARIWQWKDQYEQRIISQQQRMGCSCDWQRHRFTMDAICARAVRHAFFQMFGDGLIFRGKRLVNWDVFLQTSVSDDEVYHETVAGHFYHLRYPFLDPRPGEPTHVVVATTRPETMLGDTAVAVHPDPAAALEARMDKVRAQLERGASSELEAELAALEARKREVLPGLIMLRDMARDGRKIRLPLMDREIPLICDEWAKPELGSGCVKITPAHDPNDYEVWKRHKAEIDIISILSADGTLNQSAGAYAGLDRYVARERVVADLDQAGLLVTVEDRAVEVGHSDRSKTPIEPFLSDQWFVHMGDVDGGVVMGAGTGKEHRAPGLVQAAMDAVTTGRVKFHPERYTKTYLDWLGEKRDWPISRQLWWGHRIPVWSRRVRWADFEPSELAAILPALGRGAAARVHMLDSGGSVRILPDGSLADKAPAAGETCTIDICLLGDDDAQIRTLESRGYVRDPDVLDTWFSSALWPFSTLGWPDPATAQGKPGDAPLAAQGNAPDTLAYYYPGSCLVTGRDIITLWVARMVLAGLYCLGDVPFSDVFIHANILDGKGERMSKSKGNGIDPVDIIDEYGTDAMRYVLCDMQTGTQDIRLPVVAICPSCSADNDLAETKHGRSIFTYMCQSCGVEFDVLGTMPDVPAARLLSKRFEIGRAFCTKLWNSARFALMNLAQGSSSEVVPEELELEDRWILHGLNQTVAAVTEGLLAYNPSLAINAARDFFWGSLCDWYLELIKARLGGTNERSAQVARRTLAYCLDITVRLLHPFVPFLTEYVWQELGKVAPERSLGAYAPAGGSAMLIRAAWPTPRQALAHDSVVAPFALLQDLTRAVREARASAGVSPRDRLTVTVKAGASERALVERGMHVLERLAGVERVHFDADAKRPPGAAVVVVGGIALFVHNIIDDAAEKTRLEKERGKVVKEIAQCEKKLGNPGFTDRAPPEVVEEQRQRLAQYKERLEAIDQGLAQLLS